MKTVKLKTRNAFTLIEMVVVMALLGVVLSIATAMIIGLMQFSSSEVRLGNRNMEVAALATLFRNDVRESKTALVTHKEDKFGELKLVMLSGGEITYKVDNGVCIRVSPQGMQRLMKVDAVENLSFQVMNNGSMVEFNYEEKSAAARLRGRIFSFRAALNRGQK